MGVVRCIPGDLLLCVPVSMSVLGFGLDSALLLNLVGADLRCDAAFVGVLRIRCDLLLCASGSMSKVSVPLLDPVVAGF